MKMFVAGLILSFVAISGGAKGSVYDYSIYGMDGGDWSNVDNGAWLVWAVATTSADRYRIDYDPFHWFNQEGMGGGSMKARAWRARPYEKITRVDFYSTYNANPALFTPVIYKMEATETALSVATPIVWQGTTSGWVEGSNSITFTEAQDVQKVAVGLNVPVYGYYSFLVDFSDVVITTVKNAGTGRVDGVVNNDEYDVVCYDLFGGANAGGTWVSETHPKMIDGNVSTSGNSITDLYRWGCQVENGVFYAFIELKNQDIGILDSGSTCGPCSFYGFFIDVDNNSSTGYAHKDFPNVNGLDVDLEVGSDYGYLGQTGTINFWYGEDDFDSHKAAVNAQAYYLGNVLEISCPVADILAQTGVSATNGRFWRIVPRVAGCLEGSGATAWEADVADAAVIDITNKSPKVIPVLDGQVSAEEWAGGLFCDMTIAGTYAETDGTATSGSTSDISRWGAKIINGVYYGFVEIDPSSEYSFDAYNNGVPYTDNKFRRINVNHYLDIDGDMTNGTAASIPAGINVDKIFDLAFECEVTNSNTPMELRLGDTDTVVNNTNVREFWNTTGNSYVYEWSCPMSVMEAWATANVGSVQEAIRVMARVNGTLRDVGSQSTDASMPAMIKAITLQAGDANLDNAVDVGDLGILAANYGGTNKTWAQGDFNNDGAVDVGDLGILAAHYGTNASGADFGTDSAKVFGDAAMDAAGDEDETTSSICSGLGLPLITGLALMGLMLVKLED
jgi:hypothetical protein